MTGILGIDLSLRATGLAILYPPDMDISITGFPNATFQQSGNDWRNWSTVIDTSDVADSPFLRWKKIVTTIMQWARHAKVVVIEGYSFGSPAGMRASIEIGGIVRYVLMAELKDHPIIEIPPLTLKKFVTGTAKADKNVMLLQTYKRWGAEFDNSDACDAFCLAKLGQALTIGVDDLTSFQIEIVEKLKKKTLKNHGK